MLNLVLLTAQPGHRGTKHRDQAPATNDRILKVAQGGQLKERLACVLGASGCFHYTNMFVCQGTHSQIVYAVPLCVCGCLCAFTVCFHTNFLKSCIVSPGQF